MNTCAQITALCGALPASCGITLPALPASAAVLSADTLPVVFFCQDTPASEPVTAALAERARSDGAYFEGEGKMPAAFRHATALLEASPAVLFAAVDCETGAALVLTLKAQNESDDPEVFQAAWNRGPFVAVHTREVPPADSLPDEERGLTAFVSWLLTPDVPVLARRRGDTVIFWGKNTDARTLAEAAR